MKFFLKISKISFIPICSVWVCVPLCVLPVYQHNTPHMCKIETLQNVNWLSPDDEGASNLYLYISQIVYNKHILYV